MLYLLKTITMAAPKGNQFWKLRSSHGREKTFQKPEHLWESACEYFEWCVNNPLKEEKPFGTGYTATISLMRAFTLTGLQFFLEIDENTWVRYRQEEPYKDFWAVVKKIEQVVYSQKFEGAAAGLLNPNIIARDLGLVDKSDLTTKGEKVSTTPIIQVYNQAPPFAQDESDIDGKE